MKLYHIEAKKVDRGGPDWTVFIRRPRHSSIAIGVGVGHTLTEAVSSAVAEVRLRRQVGQFR